MRRAQSTFSSIRAQKMPELIGTNVGAARK
jgi:hypothetical protein